MLVISYQSQWAELSIAVILVVQNRNTRYEFQGSVKIIQVLTFDLEINLQIIQRDSSQPSEKYWIEYRSLVQFFSHLCIKKWFIKLSFIPGRLGTQPWWSNTCFHVLPPTLLYYCWLNPFRICLQLCSFVWVLLVSCPAYTICYRRTCIMCGPSGPGLDLWVSVTWVEPSSTGPGSPKDTSLANAMYG